MDPAKKKKKRTKNNNTISIIIAVDSRIPNVYQYGTPEAFAFLNISKSDV